MVGFALEGVVDASGVVKTRIRAQDVIGTLPQPLQQAGGASNTCQTGHMEILTEDRRQEFLTEHPEWDLEGESISRMFVFADFGEAMGFVNRVSLAAEKADHHPDIDIRWNKVTLVLSTHEAGGLTEKDTTLASELDGFVS